MLTTFMRLPILAFFFVLAGCSGGGPQSGTDVGNGATVSINWHAYQAPNGKGAQSLGLADGTRLDAVWMGVQRMRLRPGADCSGGDNEIDVQGPLVDLVVAAAAVGA